jgi:hypothetical protein
MASLVFDHTYLAGVSQTTTITVLGEASDKVVVTDEDIQVNVTAEKLNSLMVVGAQTTPGVDYPTVTLNWTALATELNAVYDRFVLVDQTVGSVGVTFADDNGDGIATLGFNLVDDSDKQSV